MTHQTFPTAYRVAGSEGELNAHVRKRLKNQQGKQLEIAFRTITSVIKQWYISRTNFLNVHCFLFCLFC